MKRTAHLLALTLVIVAMQGCGDQNPAATATADVVCSFAPSQSAVVSSISSAVGGASGAVAALGHVLGLSVVSHSSGAYILTGAGGYLAGTLGVAVTAPVIVVVGSVVGGTAVTFELLCASKNYPNAATRINAAAKEFLRRSGDLLKQTPNAVDGGRKAAEVLAKNATVEVRRVAGDVYDYAYRVSR